MKPRTMIIVSFDRDELREQARRKGDLPPSTTGCTIDDGEGRLDIFWDARGGRLRVHGPEIDVEFDSVLSLTLSRI